MKKIVAVIVLSFVLSFLMSSYSLAASFDCNKASTNHEKMICNDPTLNALDEAMGRIYKQVAALDSSLIEEQREFNKKYRECWDLGGCRALVMNRNITLHKKLNELGTQVRISNIIIDATGGEACLELSHKILPGLKGREDYVELEEAMTGSSSYSHYPVAMTFSDEKWCLTGLRPGHHYKASLRAFDEHFLGEQSYKHKGSAVVKFKIPGLPSKLQFHQESAYVLPATQQPIVPINATNVDKLFIRLYRASPEQVQEEMAGGDFLKKVNKRDYYQTVESTYQFIGGQSIDLNIKKNKVTNINLDLTNVLAGQKPGVFYVAAKKGEDFKGDDYGYYSTSIVYQKIIYTDIGLTSYQSKSGLDIYARSYRDASPRARVNVQLIAKNHDVLASVVTDNNGRAHFYNAILKGKAGHSPSQIRVLGKDGQMAVLSLTGQYLDLSDRGIDGKDSLGLLNAYLFSERGVYRLGEQAVVTGIIRDQDLHAPKDMPLTFKLIRPNGDVAFSRPISKLQKGGFQETFKIPTSGRTGAWTAALYLNANDSPIGEVNLEVADYIPETIEVAIDSSIDVYRNRNVDVAVASDFLYGAPASNLKVEAKAVLVKKPRLFNQYPAYVFGSSAEWSQSVHKLDETKTDNNGKATITIPGGILKESDKNLPMNFVVRVGVEEPSGRVAQRQIFLPVSQFDSWVGVKSDQEHPVYDEDKPEYFNLVNLSTGQNPLSNRQLSYKVIREEWDYNWYYSDGWKYKISQFDREVVARGSVETGSLGTAGIEIANTQWGRYRLEVTDETSGQVTQLQYRKGWWNPDGAQSAMPDNVRLAPSVKTIQVGGVTKLQVEAPYPGRLHLIVANDSIIEEHFLDLDKGKGLLELTAKEEWGHGVYFMATVYRASNKEHGAARAIGVNYVEVNRPEFHAKVSIDSKAKIRPNNSYMVKVDTDLPKGGKLVVSIVDEGILQLTKFRTPSPEKWFLAKRKLDLETRDLYGHLIQNKTGEVIRLHFGGDGNNAPVAPPMETFVKPVALVTKLVTVDANGDAEVDFDVPQFNGRLRIMAIAFDERAMGSTEGQVTVRNPIVVQPQLPRFIAASDGAMIGVSLHNMELPETNVRLEWQTTGGLAIASKEQNLTLLEGQRLDSTLRLWGVEKGKNQIKLAVVPEVGAAQFYEWDLTVVGHRLVEQHLQQVSLHPGEQTIILSKVGQLLPDTRKIEVSATASPLLQTKWISDGLSNYPFGCLEQTTSKAWPMLLSSESTMEAEKKEEHINKAINHLATMQLSNGSFSLWSGGSTTQTWLTMYAFDFMLEARSRGYDIPRGMFDRAETYVRNFSTRSDLGALSYALYLQVKLGGADLGLLRYVSHDVSNGRNFGAQTYNHIILANDLLGNRDVVETLLDALNRRYPSHGWDRRNYSSNLRDKAMNIFVRLEAKTINDSMKDAAILDVIELFEDARETYWLSTQEKAWLLRLADKVGPARSLDLDLPITLDLSDNKLAYLASYLEKQDRFTRLRNTSKEDMYLSITSTGINTSYSQPSNNGLTIDTNYLDLATGKSIDLDKVRVGLNVLVNHEVTVPRRIDQEISMEARIPAGFELENPRLSGHRTELADLPRTEPNFEEFRDNSYLAAWSLRGCSGLEDCSIHISYVMRAVTEGEFLLPAVLVEDMYRPKKRANTKEGLVSITASQ